MAKTRIPILSCIVMIHRSVVLGAGDTATYFPVDEDNPPRKVNADIPAKTKVERAANGDIISETVITPMVPDLGDGVELVSIAAQDRAESIGLPDGAPEGSVMLPDGTVLAPAEGGTYAPWTPPTSGLAAAAVHNPPVSPTHTDEKPEWAKMTAKPDIVAYALEHKVVVRDKDGAEVDLNDPTQVQKTTAATIKDAIELHHKALGQA